MLKDNIPSQNNNINYHLENLKDSPKAFNGHYEMNKQVDGDRTPPFIQLHKYRNNESEDPLT